MNAPAGSRAELREFVADALEMAALQAQLGVTHADTGDDVGLTYAVRKLAALTQAALQTVADLRGTAAPMRDDYWIELAQRDIAGMVLDLGPAPEPEPMAKRDENDVVAERWRQAEANAERVLRAEPPEWTEPPAATLAAARYVASRNDPAAAAAFLAGRPVAEQRAILDHLKRHRP